MVRSVLMMSDRVVFPISLCGVYELSSVSITPILERFLEVYSRWLEFIVSRQWSSSLLKGLEESVFVVS